MQSGGLKEAQVQLYSPAGANVHNFNGIHQMALMYPMTFCCDCAKMAESIDLAFRLWTRVGWRKHKFNRIRRVAPMCPHGRVHWCNLANTTEPSVCGGNAALRQITLTTCYYYYYAALQYYVDVAYCYRRSSVVCLSVLLVSSAKIAEPIRMQFGMLSQVGPGNQVLNGGTHWCHLVKTNRLCAAAMWPYIKLLWPLVLSTDTGHLSQRADIQEAPSVPSSISYRMNLPAAARKDIWHTYLHFNGCLPREPGSVSSRLPQEQNLWG